VKAGRTAAGARAASSHTGALAGLDSATDALLAQCGVIRVDTVEELFDLAMAFGHLPVPQGNRVAVVTNAGGPGIIITDACEAQRPEGGRAVAGDAGAAAENLPEEASVRNPVDMIASATPDSYRLALDAVLADPNIDAAIAAFVPPLRVTQQDVARAIVDGAPRIPDKPMLAVLMGRAGLPEGRADLWDAGVPGYIFPESAARALAAMYKYRQWLERPAGEETGSTWTARGGRDHGGHAGHRRRLPRAQPPCSASSTPTAYPRCAPARLRTAARRSRGAPDRDCPWS
jgi:acetate---CoA ligase (ADP-forming)